jgi:uncharacterized protein (TIGR02453 family)
VIEAEEPSFGPELFAFLAELRAHNERDWFQANKPRYEAEVKEPALAFIEDAAHLLPEISPHFHGSLFRIYRDTRFGKDKTPYKTHTGIHFRHERAKDAHAPGFYLHLEPGQVFLGAGIWRPDAPTLRAIRDRIVARPDEWRRAIGAVGERFRMSGDSLKRAPAGFDPEHPLVEDLRRKDFVVLGELDEQTATAPGFLSVFTDRCREAAPFMRFLCDATRVAF